MEITIESRRGKSSSSSEARKGGSEYKKNVKPVTTSKRESMSVSTEESAQISTKPKQESRKTTFSRNDAKKCPTLKELQEKKYSFPDSDLSGVLYNLLEKGVIE